MKFIWCLLALLAVSQATRKRFRFKPNEQSEGNTYALLVAGSNGWYNYRHQADVAHAYHTLIDHGLQKENIIVMMYDDIANNTQNPYRGELYNVPGGPNVYEGLHIDYRGKDVNVANFKKILQGDESIKGGNRRVIKSNEKDKIFIYFTDHGAVGLISFPNEMLTVKELTSLLKWMNTNQKYSELVFYLEACESGSMFEKSLPKTWNIYAITAANGHESSWGTYCDNSMNLPCLGDLFSVNWMCDSDEEDLTVETLQHQFELVKERTDKSHVLQFGDLSIAKEPVGNFQGSKKLYGYTDDEENDDEPSVTMWPSREIELNSMMAERDRTNDYDRIRYLNDRIADLHEKRRYVKKTYHNLLDALFTNELVAKSMLEKRNPVLRMNCHHEVVHAFNDLCLDFNEYEQALKYVYVLNNLCNYFEHSEIILDQIAKTCEKSDEFNLFD